MHQKREIKKRNNYFKIFILFLISFFLISTAYITTSCKKSTVAPETAVVMRGDIIQSIDISGNVDASQLKNLSLPASGKVLKSVEKGDTLKKGDILIEIDNRKTKLLVSQTQENIKIAESSLALARINYKNALDANHVAIQLAQLQTQSAQNSVESASNSIINIENSGSASIENAQLAVKKAQDSYNYSIAQAQISLNQAADKINKNPTDENDYAYQSAFLSRDSAIASATNSLNSAIEALNQADTQARASNEEAKIAYDNAQFNQSMTYWNTLSSLEQAQKQISATLESINTAQEQVNLAKINLDISSIELENSVILMPFDGLVQSVNFKEGEYLSPGIAAVSVINNEFLIKADVEETDISKIKTGQDVDISLDAFPDEKIKGTVIEISPISKNTAGVISFQVTIKPLDAKPGILMFGLSVNAVINTNKVENVLTVPSVAVFDENNKSYVLMLNDKNETVKVEVKTGLSDLENIEIKSGLKEGDIVLISKPESAESSLTIFNNQ